jgi:hypothetical protein
VPQNVVDISSLPMRGPASTDSAQAPTDETLTGSKPLPALGPTVHAANTPSDRMIFANDRPVGLPVLVARLQHLMFPDAVGATTEPTSDRSSR